MKLITNLLLLAFYISCSSSSVRQNDLSDLNLNGKVKSYKVLTYKVNSMFGEVIKGENRGDDYEQFIFNEEGNVTENNGYKLKGDLKYKTKFKYNKNNNLIERVSYLRDGSAYRGALLYYDSLGNMIKVIPKANLEGSKFSPATYCYYDENNNCIEDQSIYLPKVTSDTERVVSKTLYSYDENGNETTMKYYPDGKDLFITYKSKYDSKNRKTESSTYFSRDDGKLGSTTKYEYNQYNDIVKEKELQFDYSSENVEVSKYEKEYKYKYDNQNNWIEKIVFREDEPLYLEERIIEYY